MTIKDRILCGLGFHGKLEDTGDRITAGPGHFNIVGKLMRCTICQTEMARMI